ncbi:MULTISPECIES: SpoIIE family protein phosphatase [Streptomyces]|uniref:SpoIIE family protein phosphatase n=1 Tax=Streptomyces TaxID=1883 RepID=UPI00292DE58E|nr:SpoIIE family protein phosphatase [Streptomyces sp. NEAU-HV9]
MLPDTPVEPRGDAFAVVDGRGLVVSWSPGAERLLGYTAAQARGLAWAGLVLAQTDTARIVDLCRADRSTCVGASTLRHRDGHPVEVVLWAHPFARDDAEQCLLQAESTEAVQQRELRQALLRGLFTESPFIIDVFDSRLRFLAQNSSSSRAPGFADSVIGLSMREAAPPGLLDMEALEERQRQVLTDGEALIGTEVRGRDPREPDRDRVWSESILPLRNSDGEVIALAHMVFDVTEEARARERLDQVNEAGARIGSMLDVLHTAKELTDVSVPLFADYACVNLLNSVFGGEEAVSGPVTATEPLRRAAETVLPGERPTGLIGTGEIDPFASEPGSPGARALVLGRPLLLTGKDFNTALGTGKCGWAAELRERGVHSCLVVPMRARGALLGVVVFARFARAHPFEADDVLLAEEFVTRAGVCIDNASRYTRERTTAMALQRSLLPQSLPALGGIETASRYLPANGKVVLGGAWFDVIPLSGARVALVVGDAGGHGLHAAVTMARLRTAVRTLAELDYSPEELLAHLDDQVTRLRDEQSGRPDHAVPWPTCLYTVFDPISVSWALSSAGHPLPTLLTSAGGVRGVDVPVGAPLGTGGIPFEYGHMRLAEGDTLVLYTAGLSRPWGDSGDTRTRLRSPWSSQHPGPDPLASGRSGGLEGLCDDVLSRLLPDDLQDDVALLLARVRALAPESHATREVDVVPESVGQARIWAAQKLTAWGLEQLAFTTELLVSELVTNALRYGMPPVVLRLIRDRTLICEVSDGSSTSPHVRRALDTDEGGRGLFMVATLAKLWGTRYHTRGKTIWTEQPLPPGTGFDQVPPTNSHAPHW